MIELQQTRVAAHTIVDANAEGNNKIAVRLACALLIFFAHYAFAGDLADPAGQLDAAAAEHAAEMTTLATEPMPTGSRYRSAFLGETVVLDGNASSDRAGTPVAWRWSLIASPPLSTSELYRADTARPFFLVDVEGVYVVELTVRDRERRSSPRQFVISTPRASQQNTLATDWSAALARGGLDSDNDGVPDDADNCIETANADQRDTDGDLFGNACDADLNNDGIVNTLDLGLLKLAFFTTPADVDWNPDADFGGDNQVNVIDLGIMKARFFGTPGPSGLLPNIACGEQQVGTIDQANEGDFFQIFLSAGQVSALAVSQINGFAGSVARATLYDPAGSPIVTANAQSQTLFTATQSGVYQGVVRAANGAAAGTYGLGLICIQPAMPVEAILNCGDVNTAAIDAVGDADLYSFEGTAGDVVALTISGSQILGRVFGPTGIDLTNFYGGNKLLLTLPATGSYTVEIVGSGFTATGTYSVGLECMAPPSPDAVPLTCGDLHSGDIVTASETDLFVFSGTAGDAVLLTITGSQIRSRIFGPTGVALTGYVGGNQLPLTLPVSGTYVAEVVGLGFTAVGGYSLGLECLAPPSPDALMLSYGDVTAGSILAPSEVDLFTFDGDAGEVVAVTITGSQKLGQVFGPSGVALTGFFGGNQILLTLAESGTYVVQMVGNFFTSLGDYVVGLESLSPPTADAVTLVYGDLVNGSILTAAETDLFKFSGTAGEVVALTITGSQMRARLIDPAGTALTGFYGGNQALVTLPQNGTYVVQIVGTSFVSTGDYALGLESLAPPSPDAVSLNCASSIAGSISSASETDLYTFSGSQDDEVTLTISGSQILAQVFRPSGAALTGFFGGVLPLTLSESGTYVVEVVGSAFLATGGYDLSLACP